MADIIDQLVGLDDAALGKKLGFDEKLDQFKADLTAAGKLTGKPREMVVSRLTDIFTPQSYAVSDFHHSVTRAQEKASAKTTPQSIVDCCCGDAEID